MSVFTGAAGFYQRFRPGIPAEVAAVLDEAAPRRSAGARRLLDIGTGTGQVVEALLGRFTDIIAIDNDTAMLAAAGTVLRPVLPEGSRLELVKSTAENFTPAAGWRADLVTISRAFHWLDQKTVLERLDRQVSPDGSVAIFGDSSFWAAGSPWKEAVRDVIKGFLGEKRRAGSGTFSQHDRPYSEIMRESPFGDVTELTVPVHRIWNTAGILGYLYSTSFASPGLLGKRLPSSRRSSRTGSPASVMTTPSEKRTSSSSVSAAGCPHDPHHQARRPGHACGRRPRLDQTHLDPGSGGHPDLPAL